MPIKDQLNRMHYRHNFIVPEKSCDEYACDNKIFNTHVYSGIVKRVL